MAAEDNIYSAQQTSWLKSSFRIVAWTIVFSFFILPISMFTLLPPNSLNELERTLISIIPQIIMLIAIFIIALYPHEKNLKPSAKLKIDIEKWKNIIIIQLIGLEILLLLTISLVQKIIIYTCKSFGFTPGPPAIEQMVMNSSETSFIILAISAVFIAPVVEEIFFRLVIFEYVKKLGGEVLAVITTSALFAAIHMNWLQFASLFILGITFQLLYIKKQSLLPSILLHAMNNGFAMTLLYIFRTYNLKIG